MYLTLVNRLEREAKERERKMKLLKAKRDQKATRAAEEEGIVCLNETI